MHGNKHFQHLSSSWRWWTEAVPDERLGWWGHKRHHSKAWVRFPIRLPNYCYVLHHFRDKARYWSKIAIFSYPLHSTPPLGGPRRSIAITFGVEKLWWSGYPTVKKIDDMFKTVLTECRRVTDRQTDRHLSTAVRAMHTWRAVKTCHFYFEDNFGNNSFTVSFSNELRKKL